MFRKRPRKQLGVPPIFKAILAQLIAYLAASILATIVTWLIPTFWVLHHLPILPAVFAAYLSRKFGLEPWWHVMNFIAPFAMFAMTMLSIPPAFFLVAFIVTGLVFWSTYRTRVPFYPSSARTHEKVLGLIPAGDRVRMIDIGSGLGDLVIKASTVPGVIATGIENAPLPFIVSKARAFIMGGGARFMMGDYTRHPLSSYDLVFAYLSPAAMPDLWEKAKGEMKPGAILVSCEFPIPGVSPDIIQGEDKEPTLFVYQL